MRQIKKEKRKKGGVRGKNVGTEREKSSERNRERERVKKGAREERERRARYLTC